MAPAVKLNTYTYQDYKNFDDSMRCEIIEGKIVMMAPSQTILHQEVLGNVAVLISDFVKGKKCKACISPLDVLLDYEYKGENSDIILQPDLLVLCDKNKLDKRGILGAPELVVEILSPSTLKYDLGKKMELYLAYGVKEYWIVDPHAKTIHLNYEVNKDYEETIFYLDEPDKNIIKSRLFEGLEIPLNEVFELGF